MINPHAPVNRTILLAAWLGALAWFAISVIGSWGFALAALAWWSVVGVPLAVVTVAWLKAVGASPARGIVAAYGVIWLALLATFAIIALSHLEGSALDRAEPILQGASLLLPFALFVSVLTAALSVPVRPGPTA